MKKTSGRTSSKDQGGGKTGSKSQEPSVSARITRHAASSVSRDPTSAHTTEDEEEADTHEIANVQAGTSAQHAPTTQPKQSATQMEAYVVPTPEMLQQWMDASVNMAKYMNFIANQGMNTSVPEATVNPTVARTLEKGKNLAVVDLDKVGSHSSRQGEGNRAVQPDRAGEKRNAGVTLPENQMTEQEQYEAMLEEEERRRNGSKRHDTLTPHIRSAGTGQDRCLLDEQSPLSFRIQRLPSKVEPALINSLPRYYGSADPKEHLSDMKECLNMYGMSDGLMTKMLGYTFRDSAKRWYRRLTPQSIDCFTDLAEAFKSEFATSKKTMQLGSRVYTMIQKKDESLRLFIKRFKEAVRESDTITPAMVKQTLYQALQPCELSSKLARTDFSTVAKIFELADEFIVEEDMREAKMQQRNAMMESATPAAPPVETPVVVEKKASNNPKTQGAKNSASAASGNQPNTSTGRFRNPNFDQFTPLRVEAQQIFAVLNPKHVFRTPVPLKGRVFNRNKGKYCDYHKQEGHLTNTCVHFRKEVERLIKEQQLPKYMYVPDARETIDQRLGESKESEGRVSVKDRLGPKSHSRSRSRERSRSGRRHRSRSRSRSRNRSRVRDRSRSRSRGRRDYRRSERRDDDRRRSSDREEDKSHYGEDVNPPNRGVIHTIGGGPAAGATKTKRKKIAKELSNPEGIRRRPTREIFNVFKGCEAITFSEADLEDQQAPAYEPLVFTISIANFAVEKCLIDGGSSADILSFQAMRGMQIDTSRLKPIDSPLRAFGGGEIIPMGTINLLTSLGTGSRRRTELIEYMVVSAPFHYNVILGRPALAKFQAVPSSYHLKIKFPTPCGVGEMKCDLRRARECYNNFTNHSPPKAPKVHDGGQDMPRQEKVADTEKPETSTSGKKRKEIESKESMDARITPADTYRKIELVRGSPHKTAKIGNNLEKHNEILLIALLQKNADVFAWSPSDMKGISRNVIEHRLNVDPNVKPVRQKKRCFGVEQNRIIAEKVQELLDAKYAEEIQYSEWLCNPVLVPKKQDQWRMCNDFTDLNKACPKDHFPLPRIDILVDSTSGCAILSMLDAYQGYNQILMAIADRLKTAFITDGGVYCFRVMPFGLKNAGATYQRLMSLMFKNQIGNTVEVYVDDMIVKSKREEDHIAHLAECFSIMREYGLKLNPEKCTFGVKGGKFLGFMVTERGIEANPEKIAAIINMPSPKSVKDVQRLSGRLIALGRFISRYADKGLPFLKVLRKINNFGWTEECEAAFQKMKQYLVNPPLLKKPICGEKLYLYLAVSEVAISSVLVKDEKGSHYPVYYVSHMLQGAEKNYQNIEKLVLAIVHTARKLRPYFHSHHVAVLTNQPLRQILAKPNVSGRVIKWAVELGEYDISYESRTAIKAQVAADFLVEMAPVEVEDCDDEYVANNEKGKELTGIWTLHVDGSAIAANGGAGILLQGPGGVELQFAQKLNFKVTNNIAEYEALIAGMRIALDHEIADLRAFTDSQLIAQQFEGSYEARDKSMAEYLAKTKEMAEKFNTFTLQQVPREENERADALAKFATMAQGIDNRSITVLIANKSELDEELDEVLAIDAGESSWKDEVIQYLKEGKLPDDSNRARRITRCAPKFALVRDQLYRRSCTGVLLRCLTPTEAKCVITEIHSGSCGNHSGGRALAQKIVRQGYFWPTLRKDAIEFSRKCVACQLHSTIPHVPAVPQKPIEAACPFDMWGIDLIGPLPKGEGGKTHILVAVEYFSKWVEAKALSNTKEGDIIKFLWQNIVTRYGVPRILISDNGPPFKSHGLEEWCENHGIKQSFASVAHPQANGQTEVTNRTILNAIKKKVLGHKTRWVPELDGVLWSYRTTARISTGETPFAMVYGSEAIIPAEVSVPSSRVRHYEQVENRDARAVEIDLIDELRERGRRKTEAFKQAMSLAYNKRMRSRTFQVGDLVLKRVKATKNVKKLEPQWMGPYKIVKLTRKGSYRLEDMDGENLGKSWNVQNLIRYYA